MKKTRKYYCHCSVLTELGPLKQVKGVDCNFWSGFRCHGALNWYIIFMSRYLNSTSGNISELLEHAEFLLFIVTFQTSLSQRL